MTIIIQLIAFIICLVMALAVIVVWIKIKIMGDELLHKFVKQFPAVAIKHIKYPFSPDRHPSKLLFFLDKSKISYYSSNNEIFSLRNRVVKWLKVCIAILIVIVVYMVVIGLIFA